MGGVSHPLWYPGTNSTLPVRGGESLTLGFFSALRRLVGEKGQQITSLTREFAVSLKLPLNLANRTSFAGRNTTSQRLSLQPFLH